MLLPAKIDPILEKQSRKEDALVARSIGHIKIILALIIEVVAFHVGATIVQIGIPGLKSPFPKCKICFVMFLAFNKQF